MNQAHYKILFSGELTSGVDADTVKDNLARLFKTDRRKIERLFGNEPVTLKRHLPSDEAERYLAALRRAGAQARMEPEQSATASPPLALTALQPPVSDIDKAEMSCPKCGHLQPQQNECVACGIIVHKFLARQAQQAQTAAAADTRSPYAPPQASIAPAQPEQGELRVFSVQGRIGRLRYLAWSLVIMAGLIGLFGVAGIVMAMSNTAGIALMALLTIAAVVVNVQIGVQRLHDVGLSGWFLLLNLVPLVGTFVPLLMMALPGKCGANRYGPPQPPNSTAVKVLAALWLVLVLAGVLVAITVPGVSQHLHLGTE